MSILTRCVDGAICRILTDRVNQGCNDISLLLQYYQREVQQVFLSGRESYKTCCYLLREIMFHDQRLA